MLLACLLSQTCRSWRERPGYVACSSTLTLVSSKSNYTPRDMSKCTSSTLLRHKHCVHVQSSLPPYHTSTPQFSYIMCSRKTMSATWYLTCKLHFHRTQYTNHSFLSVHVLNLGSVLVGTVALFLAH